ncbi:MAG: dihydrofolate reductase [Comamonadaceae bacterium]|nr:MAG: dihydrofolate reductase [Comamonadaceae bacterium]
MTEIVYYVAASLDGFIAGPQDGLDWLEAFGNAGTDYGLAGFMATVDAVVMGRRTCDVALSLGDWPYGERPAWVVSRQPRPVGSALPAHVGWGPIAPDRLLAQWQRQGVRRGWLVGGGDVAGQWLRAGCVHRLMLATMPVTLGTGIALWGGAQGLRTERWVQWSYETYDNGVVTRELWRATPDGDDAVD